MAWLPVTVRACAGFLQHTSELALIQYVCVMAIVSHSTGMCFRVLVMISHSTCHSICAGSFSQYVHVLVMISQHRCALAFFTVRVYTGYVLPQQMCVLTVFTVCVCTGYVLPQHVCVLAVLQYVCVLDMVFHSTYVS